jgi:glycosyltransferase involved in cell wall biosynthesis/SAM-dependent methyltransferase
LEGDLPIDLNAEHFGEFYYSHDCGIPYERSEHWLSFFDKIAERIVQDINPISVLDAGCAWGFLVEALRNRGVEAFGIDISDYAISKVHSSIKEYCKVGSIDQPFDRKYDLIINIEVLEHMKTENALLAIQNFCKSTDRVLFSSTPFDFKEATHVNVQVPEYWSREFSRHGFYRDLGFDASFITPWSSFFIKTHKSIPNLVYEYENKFWNLNKENIDLRQHVIEQIAHIDGVELLEKKFKDEKHALQTAVESQNSDIDRLNNHIKTIESVNKELLETNTALQTAVESQHKDIDRLNNHIKTIESVNKELIDTNTALQTAVESQHKDIDRLNNHIKTIESVNKELLDTNTALQTAVESQHKDIDRLNNHIKTIESFNKELEHNNSILQETIQTLEKQDESLMIERTKTDEKLAYLFSQWEALKSSRTWKTLQNMGRFSDFPDLSQKAVDDLFNQREIATERVQREIDRKHQQKKITSNTETTIGRWLFSPLANIVSLPEAGSFQSTSSDPQFLLRPASGRFIEGTVEIRCLIDAEYEETKLRFYIDTGNGFNERDTVTVMARKGIVARARVELPFGIKKLRFDPGERIGKITIKEFDIRRHSNINLIHSLWKDNKHKVDSVGSLFRLTGKAIHTVRNGGIKALENRAYVNSVESYHHWINKYDLLTEFSQAQIINSISLFKHTPLISVVMPTYNTNTEMLRKTILSVREQLYTNWELCIADDCSADGNVRKIIEQAANLDQRIKFVFREKNGHISQASNTALSLVNGDYIAFLDHDDLLAENALFEVAKAINAQPDALILYSDEDKIDEDGNRYDPYFKPDWNPDLFVAQNYLNHLSVYKKQLVDDVGGFRIGFEGAQDWDLAFRTIERIDEKNIIHIPRVLYHWRATSGSTAKDVSQKDYITEAQYLALKEHFIRTNQTVSITIGKNSYWRVKYAISQPKPLVSIIIPTKNQKPVLKKCIDSLLKLTTYDPYEILIVNNNSDEPEVFDYFHELSLNSNIRVIDYPKPFNYSAINNFAVKESRGSVVCLLNNDIEIIDGEWLTEMVSLAVRSKTGAVGAKLFYPDGLIQHAGVILGIGGVAGHAYLLKDSNYPGQMGRALLTQNYSAVTAACMVVEKKKFEEVGGLNEENLKIAFNDVDFCIKLLKSGYRNVWTPEAKLIHHESVSRGLEDTPEKQKRFKGEIDYMVSTWSDILEKDPAYNPNLSLIHECFALAFPPRV